MEGTKLRTSTDSCVTAARLAHFSEPVSLGPRAPSFLIRCPASPVTCPSLPEQPNYSRSLSGVNTHVNGELRPLVEAGAALPAAERLLLLVLRVGAHVVADVAFEALPADVALVEPLVLVEAF